MIKLEFFSPKITRIILGILFFLIPISSVTTMMLFNTMKSSLQIGIFFSINLFYFIYFLQKSKIIWVDYLKLIIMILWSSLNALSKMNIFNLLPFVYLLFACSVLYFGIQILVGLMQIYHLSNLIFYFQLEFLFSVFNLFLEQCIGQEHHLLYFFHF